MQETDIHRLFMQVVKDDENMSEEVRQVFLTLTSATLHYRDRLKQNSNITLTVKDVRTTLGLLMEMLPDGRLPNTENAIHLGLLKIWVDELKVTVSGQ